MLITSFETCPTLRLLRASEQGCIPKPGWATSGAWTGILPMRNVKYWPAWALFPKCSLFLPSFFSFTALKFKPCLKFWGNPKIGRTHMQCWRFRTHFYRILLSDYFWFIIRNNVMPIELCYMKEKSYVVIRFRWKGSSLLLLLFSDFQEIILNNKKRISKKKRYIENSKKKFTQFCPVSLQHTF